MQTSSSQREREGTGRLNPGKVLQSRRGAAVEGASRIYGKLRYM